MANIKVAVRVRPISERELNFTGSKVVVKAQSNEISLTNLKVSSWKTGDSRERTKTYGFDYCFDSSNPDSENYATQAKIYETLGESVLNSLFSGYNACLVAYGQSASGKTFTMMGTKDDPGLTPRLCKGLFTRITQEEKNDKPYQASVSYLEIYNERVRDLLKPTSSASGLRVREHPRLGPYVQGLTRHTVCNLGSLMSYVEEGTRARKTASTLQNPSSSRSHALLTVSLSPVSQNGHPSGSGKKADFHRGSKLHLVDLAGSESAATCSGIHRLKEGANINKSLVALGNVISALAERGSSGNVPGRRFIPYRDSSLTWLLKDALGGNATTIMLATISPASGSYNETAHTLRFAQRAQSVVNRPVVNEDPIARIIRELRAEVARLKNLLLEKNIEGEVKPPCSCGLNSNQETKDQDQCQSQGQEQNDLQVVPFSPKSSTPKLKKPQELKTQLLRKYNSNEDLVAQDQRSSTSIRRFGSFESITPHTSYAHEFPSIAKSYHSRVSEVPDYEVNEPVFVDIPTLVAVLIKPDDTPQEHSTQIEEICSEGFLEESVDTEFLKDCDGNRNRLHKSPPLPEEEALPQNKDDDSQSAEVVTIKNNTELEIKTKDPKKVRANCLGIEDKRKESSATNPRKLRKQDSVDIPSKKSNLQISRTFGSVEGLSKKREAPLQRSHTNLEKRSGQEKLKKLNNIKEVEDRRTSSRTGSFWRGLGPSGTKDLQRKGSNDSDKSLRDFPFLQKAKTPLRKLSIDDLKRKTSKDSSSSSSKEDQLLISGFAKDNYQRKGSLQERGSDQESSGRSHTPIQRIRRAEIVAAVTERLYSSGKKSEEGTGATTPASDYRSPESTDVKLAAVTRMRLQEISRRMLAKRRKISADTQTEKAETIRVRDTASLTEEPKIEVQDAAVLTEQHEDCEKLFGELPVLRVKEMATLTERRKPPTIRCKDAGNVTDDCDEDFNLHSPRNDSGILSDDTQNYADSNISSAEMDFRDQERRNTENSTNTDRFSEGVDCGAQTRKEDLVELKCSHCEPKCCSRVQSCCCSQSYSHSHNHSQNHCQNHCQNHSKIHNQNHNHNHSYNHSHSCSEKSVISINLPDMISITIESPNILESRISVLDEDLRASLRDREVQTDKQTALERSTSTDDINDWVYFNDFIVKTKPNASQTDGRTFRIENIFQDPREKTYGKEIVPNFKEEPSRSIVFTKSVGTSMDQRLDFQSPLKTLRRRLSLIRERSILDAFILRRRSRSFSPHRLNPVQKVLMERAKNGYLIPLSRRRFSSSESRFSNLARHFDQHFTTLRGEANFFDGRGLRISKMDLQGGNKEVKGLDSYFSDDSLDLMVREVVPERIEDVDINESKVEGVEAEGDKVEEVKENICPPDVVAQTKSSKTPTDGESLLGFELQEASDSQNESQAKKKKVSFSSPSIIELEGQSSGDSKTLLLPKSIIKKKNADSLKTEDKEEDKEEDKKEGSKENLQDLRESFQNLRMNDPNLENLDQKRDQESPISDERNILEDYLDQAVTFIRNVNSMNYVSAANILEKYLRSTRPKKLSKNNKDYVEYEGHRVSLKDDSDQYLDQEEFEIPTKAYEKCLQGIEKLEACIGKVKDHENFLKEKYEIGVEPAGAKSGLATTKQDYDNDLENENNIESDLEVQVGTCPSYNDSHLEISDNNIGGIDNILDTRIYVHPNKKLKKVFKIPESFSAYSRVTTKNDLSVRDGEDFLEESDFEDVRPEFSKADRIKAPSCFLSVPNRGNFSSKRWKCPASFRHSSLPRLTSSSNESFSSSETITASSESIDSISNFRDKVKYPSSPRAKFLKLLNERRRIVESSRKVSKF